MPRVSRRGLAAVCETSGGTRPIRSIPGVAHGFAVEHKQDRGNEDQYHLINRPRNGKKGKSSYPAHRFGYASIAREELHGANRSYDESSCGLHDPELKGSD